MKIKWINCEKLVSCNLLLELLLDISVNSIYSLDYVVVPKSVNESVVAAYVFTETEKVSPLNSKLKTSCKVQNNGNS